MIATRIRGARAGFQAPQAGERTAKGRGVGGLLLAVGLLLVACSDQEGSGPLAVGDAAPGFTLPTDAGKQVSLQDLVSRRPMLLYFHMAYG